MIYIGLLVWWTFRILFLIAYGIVMLMVYAFGLACAGAEKILRHDGSWHWGEENE